MPGTSVVALRAYVPNEQAWVCDLLSRVAKPKLLGKAMLRIQMGITDQCSQEQVTDLTSINNVFVFVFVLDFVFVFVFVIIVVLVFGLVLVFVLVLI